MAVPEQFPAGMRVLVVDDDDVCLKLIERMLRKCMYNVTACSRATVALDLLREKKGCFDIVLSDVHMPDMDGFKLLELVGLEMDLPVIMMSIDGRTSLVMRGVRHGACDYLIKPIRDEELKNLWQHVVRKKWNENREHEHSGSFDDNDQHIQVNDEAEDGDFINDGTDEVQKTQRRKRDSKEEDDADMENDDPATAKKPRVVWSVELHQQFVSAVNQLGVDKAVPKRILELMNVPCLTRENVASHLQKFRLYLKRLSGVAQQQGCFASSCGPLEQNPKLGPLGRFDIQALAASGQIPFQTLAALHAELLGQSAGNMPLPAVDKPAFFQPSLQCVKSVPVDQGGAFGQPLIKCSSNFSKPFSQPVISTEDAHMGFGAWSSKSFCSAMPGSNLCPPICNMLINTVAPQEEQQKQPRKEKVQCESIPRESSRMISVQPSCLVPSQSSVTIQSESTASINQNGSFSRVSFIDYNDLSPEPKNNSWAQISSKDVKAAVELSGSISRPSSCLVNIDNIVGQQVQKLASSFGVFRQLPGLGSTSGLQASYNVKPGLILDNIPQTQRNPTYNGKGKIIPSHFSLDESALETISMSRGKIHKQHRNKIKQEPQLNFDENAQAGVRDVQHFPPNDLMSVFNH